MGKEIKMLAEVLTPQEERLLEQADEGAGEEATVAVLLSGEAASFR